MALECGFFNSVDDDRMYNADDLSNFFFGLLTDGVARSAGAMQVRPGGGMQVLVSPGYAMVQGKFLRNTADYPLTLAAADYDCARYDRIVIRLDRTRRLIELAVLTGTPAPAPQPPALTRNDSIYEMSLALIGVAIEQEEITEDLIEDERGDSILCGYMSMQVKTSDVTALAQRVAALEEDAVRSEKIRTIDVVAEMPSTPSASTLYVVEGSA